MLGSTMYSPSMKSSSSMPYMKPQRPMEQIVCPACPNCPPPPSCPSCPTPTCNCRGGGGRPRRRSAASSSSGSGDAGLNLVTCDQITCPAGYVKNHRKTCGIGRDCTVGSCCVKSSSPPDHHDNNKKHHPHIKPGPNNLPDPGTYTVQELIKLFKNVLYTLVEEFNLDLDTVLTVMQCFHKLWQQNDNIKDEKQRWAQLVQTGNIAKCAGSAAKDYLYYYEVIFWNIIRYGKEFSRIGVNIWNYVKKDNLDPSFLHDGDEAHPHSSLDFGKFEDAFEKYLHPSKAKSAGGGSYGFASQVGQFQPQLLGGGASYSASSLGFGHAATDALTIGGFKSNASNLFQRNGSPMFGAY